MKDNQEVVKVRRSQFQPLYHFVIEDVLWMEYNIDFEDFKQTIMNYGVLVDEDEYGLVKMIYDADKDVENFFSDKFIDSD